MSFENKLVVIVNKDVETAIAMNAVAHASLAMGAMLGKETICLQDYQDASSNSWPISGMPYIVLRGKSGEIRKTIVAAKEQKITQIAFTESMIGGTFQEQLEKIRQVSEENHLYFCVALFGPWDAVSHLTKKLSLFK